MFVPFHQIAAATANEARLTVIMEASSGDIRVIGAARSANVEEDLPSATVVPESTTELLANGVAYGESYHAQSGAFQLTQFGIQIQNIAGTKREQALVTVIVELRE